MKKINVFKTKVEYLKIELENKAGDLSEMGNLGMVLNGYLSTPLNGVLKSLDDRFKK